jgi:hypothetical protein
VKFSAAIWLATAWLVAGNAQEQLTRTPLQKSNPALNAPTTYLKRTRIDRVTGRTSEYDPKPQVVPLDEGAARYGLRWIGYDGQQKTVVYHRPDRIDAVVAASVEVNAAGIYRYTHRVQTTHAVQLAYGCDGQERA